MSEEQREGAEAVAMDMCQPCVAATEARVPKAGDDTLKRTKHVWLCSEENLPDHLRPTLEALRDSTLRVARAWAIKESLRDLWTCRRKGWARRFLRDWMAWAMRSRLAPVLRVARMIRSHLANILTFFDHRVTNAVAEGLNSKIMSITRRCGGFRNPENFKTAIHFHCGGLDLLPTLNPEGPESAGAHPGQEPLRH